MKASITTNKANTLVHIHATVGNIKKFRMLYLLAFLTFFVVILLCIVLFYFGGLFIDLSQDGTPYWLNTTTHWNPWIIIGLLLIIIDFIYAGLILIWYLPFIYLKSKEAYEQTDEYKQRKAFFDKIDLSIYTKSQLKAFMITKWISKAEYKYTLNAIKAKKKNTKNEKVK